MVRKHRNLRVCMGKSGNNDEFLGLSPNPSHWTCPKEQTRCESHPAFPLTCCHLQESNKATVWAIKIKRKLLNFNKGKQANTFLQKDPSSQLEFYSSMEWYLWNPNEENRVWFGLWQKRSRSLGPEREKNSITPVELWSFQLVFGGFDLKVMFRALLSRPKAAVCNSASILRAQGWSPPVAPKEVQRHLLDLKPMVLGVTTWSCTCQRAPRGVQLLFSPVSSGTWVWAQKFRSERDIKHL